MKNETEQKRCAAARSLSAIPGYTTGIIAITVFLSCAVTPSQAVVSDSFYVMDKNSGNELLYKVTINNPLDVVNSTVGIGSAIQMDTQLAADYRDVHVMSNGNLVVESVSANRLSYWSVNGVYDSVSGQFGGGTSNGLATLHDGTFVSKNTGAANNEYKLFNNGATTTSYTGQLFQSDGTTGVSSTVSRLAPRIGGGFIVGEGDTTVNVYTSTGDALNTTLTAATTAAMVPAPTDTMYYAQFPGGWAVRSAGVQWLAYSEDLNVDDDYPGTLVSGTIGGRIVDIAPFGVDHTAALFMDTSFAPTTSGNAYIEIWENDALGDGPVRTIDLGFNLAEVSQNWNNSRMAGPVVIPEPASVAAVFAAVCLLASFALRRRRR